MWKKASSAVLTVIAVAWMCFIAYSYSIAHPAQMRILRDFNANSQFLALYVGMYVVGALAQHFYRGRKTWNFGITPLGIWAAFGVLVLASAGYMHQSGALRDSDLFLAEIHVMGWFALISASLFLLATFFHVIGDKVLSKYEFYSPMDNFVFTTGAGMMTTVAALFVLSQAHLLYTIVAWTGVLGVLIWRRKVVVGFWRQLSTNKIVVRTKVFSPVNFLFLFLTLVIASNFFALIRPIPLGFDDSILYLNLPKLNAHYHYLLNRGTAFNYMSMATFSFLLFDNDTLVMFTLFFCSFCGVLATLALARRFFSFEIGLLGATVLYLTPMIMWQSSIDLKSDQTLLYFITLAVFSMFEWIRAKAVADGRTTRTDEFKWLALSGVFAGFCIGIKFTAIPMLFAMVVLITLLYLGRTGAMAVFFLLCLIAWKGNQLRLAGSLPASQVLILAKAGLILALVPGIYALVRHRTRVLSYGLRIGVFAGMAALIFAPWAVTNAIATKSLSLGALLSGSGSSLALDLQKVGVDFSHCSQTGSIEERDRILGFDAGFDQFISLPWKATMNTTTNYYIVDVGFVFLALLPAFIGLAIWRREESLSAGIASLGWFVFWIFWVLRITQNFTGDLNTSTFTPILAFDYGLMLVLIFTVGVYATAKVRDTILTAVIVLAAVSWVFWAFVGNGVIWYGLAGFLPLILLLGYLVFHAPPFARATGWLLIFLALTVQVAYRHELPKLSLAASYAYGETDYARTVDNLSQDFLSFSDVINKHPESTTEKNYVYLIGTNLPYFIQENDRRVFPDAQLDYFNCLNLEQNDMQTYSRLKALGFRYMVASLIVTNPEKDPAGSLHQKADRLFGWIDRMVQAGKIKLAFNHKKTMVLIDLS
jgi:hypothetical protein